MGKNEERKFQKSVHAKKVEDAAARAGVAANSSSVSTSTIIVQVPPCAHSSEEKIEVPSESPAKKPKLDKSLCSWISKGKKQETFLKDVVSAMASSNVPLAKLNDCSPLRKLFLK